MPPIVQEFLITLARKGLTVVATWLVAQGWLGAGDAEHYVGGFALLLVSLIWSLWQRIRDRRTLLTAIYSPSGTTEAAVRRKARQFPPPVV